MKPAVNRYLFVLQLIRDYLNSFFIISCLNIVTGTYRVGLFNTSYFDTKFSCYWKEKNILKMPV